MTLTFEDDFKKSALDESLWNPHYRYRETINNELQTYTPDSFVLEDGVLRIRADRRWFDGKDYTSGAMTTLSHFSQTYGYFEMRARMPEGKGLWPAFWLLPVNGEWPPEIDIMEHIGREPESVHHTLHWKEKGVPKYEGQPTTGIAFAHDFHIFGLSWKKGQLIWYVDGAERYRIEDTRVPDVPMYMLVNFAVGGNWPQPPDETTKFPASYDVDYVRAYQFKDSPPEKPEPVAFLKTTLSKKIVKRGDTVRIETRAQIGDEDLGDGDFAFQISDYAANKIDEHWQKTSGNKAGAIKTFVYEYMIPESLPDGLYGVSVWFDTPTARTHIGTAAQFEVKNGGKSVLPPLESLP